MESNKTRPSPEKIWDHRAAMWTGSWFDVQALTQATELQSAANKVPGDP